MNTLPIVKAVALFVKLADQTSVYTFVPKKALDSIRSKGLLSAIKLIEDPQALALSRPKETKKFIKDTKEKFEDPEWTDFVSAIFCFFTLPDWSQIPEDHNIHKLDLVPIQINLSKLLDDYPKTKLVGVELEPFDKDQDQPDRERELSLQEIKDYTLLSPTELWKDYSAKEGYYASDVPHLMIITPDKKISSDYLIF